MTLPDRSNLDELREALEPFDRADLLAAAGALQLMPENADRINRLYGFAGVSATLPTRAGLPRISAGRLRGHLNGPLAASPFAHGEDPFDNPFVDEAAFHGGPYLILPGVDDDSPFVFRHLARAATQSPKGFSAPGFAAEARALCVSVLTLSHEIAERAGLDRFTEPIGAAPAPVFVSPERLGQAIEASGAPTQEASAAFEQLRGLIAPPGEVVVPAAERFGELRNAVTFTRADFGNCTSKLPIVFAAACCCTVASSTISWAMLSRWSRSASVSFRPKRSLSFSTIRDSGDDSGSRAGPVPS